MRRHVSERGFVLTPTYRVVNGAPEVHLHTVLEGGEPALVVDDRFVPYFFVRGTDVDTVRRLAPGTRVVETALRAFAGERVARIEVRLPGDVAESSLTPGRAPLWDTLDARGQTEDRAGDRVGSRRYGHSRNAA